MPNYLSATPDFQQTRKGVLSLNISNQEYARLAKQVSPPSAMYKTLPMAFVIGGGICTLGELLRKICGVGVYYVSEKKLCSNAEDLGGRYYAFVFHLYHLNIFVTFILYYT